MEAVLELIAISQRSASPRLSAAAQDPEQPLCILPYYSSIKITLHSCAGHVSMHGYIQYSMVLSGKN